MVRGCVRQQSNMKKQYSYWCLTPSYFIYVELIGLLIVTIAQTEDAQPRDNLGPTSRIARLVVRIFNLCVYEGEREKPKQEKSACFRLRISPLLFPLPFHSSILIHSARDTGRGPLALHCWWPWEAFVCLYLSMGAVISELGSSMVCGGRSHSPANFYPF